MNKKTRSEILKDIWKREGYREMQSIAHRHPLPNSRGRVAPNKGVPMKEEQKKKITLGLIKYWSKHKRANIGKRKKHEGMEYREWRNKVYVRDNYTCVECGKVGGVLNAHHIKSWCKHKELRYDVNNGITLCENCHKLLHKNNFREDLKA